jgi:hypothetical protein
MSLVIGHPTIGNVPIVAILDKNAKHEEMYTKYGTCRGSIGVVIKEIKNHMVQFSMQMLSC